MSLVTREIQNRFNRRIRAVTAAGIDLPEEYVALRQRLADSAAVGDQSVPAWCWGCTPIEWTRVGDQAPISLANTRNLARDSPKERTIGTGGIRQQRRDHVGKREC